MSALTYFSARESSDKRFFHALIKKRGIEDSFQIRFPCKHDDRLGGNSKFGPWLKTRSELADFKKNIKAVIVVSDSDTSQEASFIALRKNLALASGFKIPEKEKEIARAKEKPALAILMIPEGNRGNLETLCLGPSYRKWAIKAALDAFVDATPAKDFSIGKNSKMRMQCIVAASCEKRPDAGFNSVWTLDEVYHPPVDEPEFDYIAEFLNGFRKLVEAE